jgi:hypothetical protein
MVGDEVEGRPGIDDVWSVLFERFCEHCDQAEVDCIRYDKGGMCPAFLVIQLLLPDNPFVLRAMGRHMTCPACHEVGMAPPRFAFDAPVQPILVCNRCPGALWRDPNGILIERVEDIQASSPVQPAEDDSVLRSGGDAARRRGVFWGKRKEGRQ